MNTEQKCCEGCKPVHTQHTVANHADDFSAFADRNECYCETCRNKDCPCHSEQKGWSEGFEKTKFAKGGGSCFECCDYEGMYTDLQDFIERTLTAQREEMVKKIESFIDQNDDGMWAGRETADKILSLIKDTNPTN